MVAGACKILIILNKKRNTFYPNLNRALCCSQETNNFHAPQFYFFYFRNLQLVFFFFIIGEEDGSKGKQSAGYPESHGESA